MHKRTVIALLAIVVSIAIAGAVTRHIGLPISKARHGMVTGTLSIDDENLDARIYNGTGWRLRSITARVTLKPLTEPPCKASGDNPLLKGKSPSGLDLSPNCEQVKKEFKDLPEQIKKPEVRSYLLKFDCGAGQTARVKIPSATLVYDRKIEWEVVDASGFPF